MTRDSIFIEGLETSCIVGVLSDERQREQPLRVDLELEIELATAGQSGRIIDTCDYDLVCNEVISLLRFRRYRLLEMAACETAAMLLGLHPGVARVGVRMSKPTALVGRARAAAIEIARTRDDFPRRFEAAKFGQVEILLENREAGLYLLHVDPGATILNHLHKVMRELEWLVHGELVCNGAPAVPGQAVVWPLASVHGYENRGSTRATLFCCDTPPFIREDEVVVEGGNG